MIRARYHLVDALKSPITKYVTAEVINDCIFTMRKSYIHSICLVLLVISTTGENVSVGNRTSDNYATSKHTLLHTSFLTLSRQQTIPIRKSTETRLESADAKTVKLQASRFLNSRTHENASWSESTRTQSVRNLYNTDTQSTTVRDLFKYTQIQSADLQIISSTKTAPLVMPDNTNGEVKPTETCKLSNSVNSVTFEVHKSSINGSANPHISQHATVLSNRYLSVKISSTIPSGNSLEVQKSHTRSAKDHFQSKTINFQSSYESFHTRTSRDESSTFGHFLKSTQALQPSRIIETTLPGRSDSLTAELQINTHLATSRFNEWQRSTIEDLSKTVERPHITLTFASSQLKTQGSNSYLAHTDEYLSSTSSANIASRIIHTAVGNISKTTEIKENRKTHSGRSEKTMENLTPSFTVKEISSTGSILMRVSKNRATSLRTSQSGYQSAEIKSANEVTDTKSRILSTEIHVLSSKVHPSSPSLTTSHNKSSSKVAGMPLYVLAICLPLAALLGFALAFVYFRRNKQDQRVRYSVTVEISADKPDYELKRMYSIIDVTGGINKEFLSDLESRKSSKGILDQLDNVSVSITQSDQTI